MAVVRRIGRQGHEARRRAMTHGETPDPWSAGARSCGQRTHGGNGENARQRDLRADEPFANPRGARTTGQRTTSQCIEWPGVPRAKRRKQGRAMSPTVTVAGVPRRRRRSSRIRPRRAAGCRAERARATAGCSSNQRRLRPRRPTPRATTLPPPTVGMRRPLPAPNAVRTASSCAGRSRARPPALRRCRTQ